MLKKDGQSVITNMLQGEDFETEGKVKGMVMDMEDDAADMSKR